MEEVIKDGGEGIIMRKKGSLYIPGRSDSLIKMKVIKIIILLLWLKIIIINDE